MKKPSPWNRHMQIRRAAADRRRLRRYRLGRAPIPQPRTPVGKLAEGRQFARRLERLRFKGSREVHYVLNAPRQLHFGTSRNEVAQFTAGIRKLFGALLRVYLDFTDVQLAAPAAALYVAAEIDRWRQHRNVWTKPRVYDFAAWAPSIRRYFRDVGLFELLEVANLPDDPPSASPTKVLRMRRNDSVDPASVVQLRDELHTLCGSVPNSLNFFDALCEAMNNVIHHAYKDPDPDDWPRLHNRWWMTADFDPKNGQLRIAFLDQGVGIPARLPRSGLWEHLEGYMTQFFPGRNDDASRIQAALQYGRSSTGHQGRGQGFHDMQMFVDGSPHNWMRVLSGFGEVLYRDRQWVSTQHAEPVVGTIVEWSLLVPEG